jgi:transposase
VLSAGQASDKAAVEALIDGLKPAQALVADRGYDARAVIDLVAARGGRAHIPTQKDRKAQRSVDPMLYRQRNLIERYFCKIKHVRRIATRFDKLARNFLAAVTLASARLWLRAGESRTKEPAGLAPAIRHPPSAERTGCGPPRLAGKPQDQSAVGGTGQGTACRLTACERSRAGTKAAP